MCLVCSSRLAFRKARIAAKKRLAEAQKLERQLILKSYSAPIDERGEADDTEEAAPHFARQPQYHRQQQYHSSLSEEDKQTVGASSNVSNALRRTHDLIAAELSRSEFAHKTLTESSAALKELNESYGSLDSMLSKSRDLLGTLLRSQKSDTWYLQTAFYMLLTTAAWLVFRRLLYGPIWWLVLFPLRILFGVGSTATRALLPAGKNDTPSNTVVVNSGRQNMFAEAMSTEDVPMAQVGAEDGHEEDDDDVGVMEEIARVVEAAVGDGDRVNVGSGNDNEEDGAGKKIGKGVKDTIQKAAEAIVGDGEGDSGQEMDEMGDEKNIPERAEEGLKEGIQHAAEAVIGDIAMDFPQEENDTDDTEKQDDAPEEDNEDAKDSITDTAGRVVAAIVGDGEGDSGQEIEEMGDVYEKGGAPGTGEEGLKEGFGRVAEALAGDEVGQMGVDDKGDAPGTAKEGLKEGFQKVAEAIAGDGEGGSGQERDEL